MAMVMDAHYGNRGVVSLNFQLCLPKLCLAVHRRRIDQWERQFLMWWRRCVSENREMIQKTNEGIKINGRKMV